MKASEVAPGMEFYYLRVVRTYRKTNENKQSLIKTFLVAECECECGSIVEIRCDSLARTANERRGGVKSCGCKKGELIAASAFRKALEKHASLIGEVFTEENQLIAKYRILDLSWTFSEKFRQYKFKYKVECLHCGAEFFQTCHSVWRYGCHCRSCKMRDISIRPMFSVRPATNKSPALIKLPLNYKEIIGRTPVESTDDSGWFRLDDFTDASTMGTHLRTARCMNNPMMTGPVFIACSRCGESYTTPRSKKIRKAQFCTTCFRKHKSECHAITASAVKLGYDKSRGFCVESCIDMRISGMTWAEIVKRTGVSKATIKGRIAEWEAKRNHEPQQSLQGRLPSTLFSKS